jgi:hypothetical protein
MTELAEESDEETLWNASMRRQVTEYVFRQGILYGQIGDAPA